MKIITNEIYVHKKIIKWAIKELKSNKIEIEQTKDREGYDLNIWHNDDLKEAVASLYLINTNQI